MNVGMLKDLLEDIPDETEVVLASDSDGDIFSVLARVTGEHCDTTRKYAVEMSCGDEENEASFTECLVLWPT